MSYYKKCEDGVWRMTTAAPPALSRGEQVQAWVEADLLPFLYTPGTKAMEQTLITYLSVTDELIEKCITDHDNWKKGKHQEMPKKKRDIPVPAGLLQHPYISEYGVQLGDRVLLKDGKIITLERVDHKGEFEQRSTLIGATMAITHDNIVEVVEPVQLNVGDWVRFKEPFDKQIVESLIEGFSLNSSDAFVRITRNGRKIPVAIDFRNLELIKEELKAV